MKGDHHPVGVVERHPSVVLFCVTPEERTAGNLPVDEDPLWDAAR